MIVNTDGEYTYLGRLAIELRRRRRDHPRHVGDNVAINGAYASTAANVAAAWGTTVGNLETTAFANGTKGDQVRDITQAVDSVIAVKDGTVFGFTDVYLEGERAFIRSQETNLGSLSADTGIHALKEALGDAAAGQFIVGLRNGGGIRAQIGSIDHEGDKTAPVANPDAGKAAGGVSQLDVENALRFDNKLMAFDTTAAGLKAILEHGVAAGINQGRFAQVGGLRFSWDPDLAAGSRILSVALVDGERPRRRASGGERPGAGRCAGRHHRLDHQLHGQRRRWLSHQGQWQQLPLPAGSSPSATIPSPSPATFPKATS